MSPILKITLKVKRIICPSEKCDFEITEDFITALSSELGHAYHYARLFISPNVRRCVGKDCERFIEGSPENPHIVCECGAELCFNCGASWHLGLTCEQVVKFCTIID